MEIFSVYPLVVYFIGALEILLKKKPFHIDDFLKTVCILHNHIDDFSSALPKFIN